MTGTALARPIEDIQRELHDILNIAGDQPTREQRVAQCARMSELHDALNAKALTDGSLFVSVLAAKRLGAKGMGWNSRNGRRTAHDVVGGVFGLRKDQQKSMLREARNPEGFKLHQQRANAKKMTISSAKSLLKAITVIYLRSTPLEREQILDHVAGLCHEG